MLLFHFHPGSVPDEDRLFRLTLVEKSERFGSFIQREAMSNDLLDWHPLVDYEPRDLREFTKGKYQAPIT